MISGMDLHAFKSKNLPAFITLLLLIYYDDIVQILLLLSRLIGK